MRTRETWQDLEVMAAMARRRSAGADGAVAEALQWAAGDLFIDLTRSGLTPSILSLLLDFAREQGLDERRAALFDGQSSALPGPLRLPLPTLRRPLGQSAIVDGRDLSLVLEEHRLWPETLAEAVRDGTFATAAGGRFSDVIHLDLAADDPGPAMLARSLGSAAVGPCVHFVTEAEGGEIATLMARLDPSRTLVLFGAGDAAGRAFRHAAEALSGWLARHLGAEPASRHMAAVTADPEPLRGLGLAPERIIAAPHRMLAGFSAWSPVHLGLMIAVGPETLRRVRHGAHEMDLHFQGTPVERNLPVLLALTDLWLEDALGMGGGASVSYDPGLCGWARFAAHHRRAARPAGRCERACDRGLSLPFASSQAPAPALAEVVLAALPHSEEWADYLMVRTAEALAAVRLHRSGRGGADPWAMLRNLGLSGEAAAERAERHALAGQEPSILIGYRRLDPERLGSLMALAEHR
ncbi:MAG TPA: hypothetical protein VFR34_03990, partial [Paracoccaceae bacterium]|nr:hypothetical protein [Paracoccaceae bacterium]